MLYVGIALVFERLKIKCLRFLPENRAYKKSTWFECHVFIYILLALLSWCASIGSLTSNVSTKHNAAEHIQQANAIVHANINRINHAIQQNNKIIDFYHQKELIQLHVIPLQQKNATLQAQLKQEQSQLLALPNATAMDSIINNIQKTLDLPYEITAFLLAALFSLLLEIAYAFFIVLSASERMTTSCPSNPLQDAGKQHLESTISFKKTKQKCIEIKESKQYESKKSYNESEVIKAILMGRISPSKRAVLDRYTVGAHKVNRLFKYMMAEEIIQSSQAKRRSYALRFKAA